MASGHFTTIPVPNGDDSDDDLRESTGTAAAPASTGLPGAVSPASPLTSHGDAAAAPEAAEEAAHTGLTSNGDDDAAAGAASGSPASEIPSSDGARQAACRCALWGS